MSKRYGPNDIRRLSTRGISARGSSDVHSKTPSQQAGTGRLDSPGMLSRLKRSIFGSGEEHRG